MLQPRHQPPSWLPRPNRAALLLLLPPPSAPLLLLLAAVLLRGTGSGGCSRGFTPCVHQMEGEGSRPGLSSSCEVWTSLTL